MDFILGGEVSSGQACRRTEVRSLVIREAKELPLCVVPKDQI